MRMILALIFSAAVGFGLMTLLSGSLPSHGIEIGSRTP